MCANKKIESNCIYGGNPVKKISKDIFWNEKCVHSWTKLETKKHITDNTSNAIFYNNNNYISFDSIDNKLKQITDVNSRLQFLKDISKKEDHNRFALNKIPSKKIKKLKRKIKKTVIGKAIKKVRSR